MLQSPPPSRPSPLSPECVRFLTLPERQMGGVTEEQRLIFRALLGRARFSLTRLQAGFSPEASSDDPLWGEWLALRQLFEKRSILEVISQAIQADRRNADLDTQLTSLLDELEGLMSEIYSSYQERVKIYPVKKY